MSYDNEAIVRNAFCLRTSANRVESIRGNMTMETHWRASPQRI
jgi:hypothetical protein